MRWGLNVTNMIVVTGETGDTDHEELISGSHKTIIIRNVVENGSEELLRTAESYQKEDIVPRESTLLVHANGISADDLSNAIKQVCGNSSRMQ